MTLNVFFQRNLFLPPRVKKKTTKFSLALNDQSQQNIFSRTKTGHSKAVPIYQFI